MPEVTIYHNPRCATSRKTLDLLRKRGVEPRIVEYLKTPPDEAELRRLLKLLGIAPRALLRKKEAKEAGLDKPSLTDAEIIAGMAKHPIAIERPIVVKGARAALGRPPEAALKIFSHAAPMIRGFSDHAANERTFLAWVRTGIAVVAFGFLIERFNLFLLAVASSASLQTEQRLRIERLSGPLGRYDGLALIVGGLALILVATFRFFRTGRLLDDQEMHEPGGLRLELVMSAALVVAVAGLSAYLVIG